MSLSPPDLVPQIRSLMTFTKHRLRPCKHDLGQHSARLQRLRNEKSDRSVSDPIDLLELSSLLSRSSGTHVQQLELSTSEGSRCPRIMSPEGPSTQKRQKLRKPRALTVRSYGRRRPTVEMTRSEKHIAPLALEQQPSIESVAVRLLALPLLDSQTPKSSQTRQH